LTIESEVADLHAHHLSDPRVWTRIADIVGRAWDAEPPWMLAMGPSRVVGWIVGRLVESDALYLVNSRTDGDSEGWALIRRTDLAWMALAAVLGCEQDRFQEAVLLMMDANGTHVEGALMADSRPVREKVLMNLRRAVSVRDQGAT
jgi:hypothetical protein